jgi:iron complex transport system substrate-binding protein
MRRLVLVVFLSVFFLFCVQPHTTLNGDGDFEFNLTSIFNTALVDDTGHNVSSSYPERIVSLAPSNTEILFALGAGDRVVGVTDYCNYPPEVVEKKKMGEVQTVGGYSTVNIERVLALNPDLVVASYGNGLDTIETLRNLGLNVIAFDPKNITDVMRDIILIGVATGNYEKAKEVVEEMATRIEAVKLNVSGKEKVRVAHIIWHDPIWVSGKNTFVNEVIELAGGENVFDFDGWKIVSVEDLIAANPDVILVSSGSGMGGGRDVVYEWVIQDERLKTIKAVKNGRVYIVDADIISRPSYRLVEAVEIIAKMLHSD